MVTCSTSSGSGCEPKPGRAPAGCVKTLAKPCAARLAAQVLVPLVRVGAPAAESFLLCFPCSQGQAFQPQGRSLGASACWVGSSALPELFTLDAYMYPELLTNRYITSNKHFTKHMPCLYHSAGGFLCTGSCRNALQSVKLLRVA